MKSILSLIPVVMISFSGFAQDSTDVVAKISINGYIKNLETLSFDKDFRELITGNLIHNRINLKWKPAKGISAVVEFRNRLFWGEQVKLTPGFASLLRNQNEKINLQKTWINDRSLVLHTNVERLYFDLGNDKWDLRLGRQRINWGINTTWNPNDIFNVYNFLDFDYEERPGVDGGKVQYMFTNTSEAEIAYAFTGADQKSTGALKYAWNKWNYDMQLIAGWYNGHLTLGTGWAGYIGDGGFKGEAQYFFKTKDSPDHFNMTFEGDYLLKNGWYINTGFLFNNHGLYKTVNTWQSINLSLSPENLMPTKWNVIVTTAKEFNPLLSATVSMIYAPGTNLLILFPSVKYSIATNLDVNLVWQSYLVEVNRSFEAVSHQCFLRMKWNF
ncbi:MAG: hypothetical protein WAT91_09725 [Saprospiraceae bacterium]